MTITLAGGKQLEFYRLGPSLIISSQELGGHFLDVRDEEKLAMIKVILETMKSPADVDDILAMIETGPAAFM